MTPKMLREFLTLGLAVVAAFILLVLLATLAARLFGAWPDWMIEAEVIVKSWLH